MESFDKVYVSSILKDGKPISMAFFLKMCQEVTKELPNINFDDLSNLVVTKLEKNGCRYVENIFTDNMKGAVGLQIAQNWSYIGLKLG
tara:strand:- start:140 stop:403 length:264 start_codon:yes stop_codon:yes gene_type:complete